MINTLHTAQVYAFFESLLDPTATGNFCPPPVLSFLDFLSLLLLFSILYFLTLHSSLDKIKRENLKFKDERENLTL
jgi:hypothetical protein